MKIVYVESVQDAKDLCDYNDYQIMEIRETSVRALDRSKNIVLIMIRSEHDCPVKMP